MEQEFVTLPREVVERVLEALEHAEKDSADFQRINTDQTGDAIAALRAALEQPQKKQELLTEEAIQKLIVPGDYLTLGGLVKFARSVEQAVSGHTGPQQREVRFAELEIALKNMQHQHKLSNDNELQRENGHLITSSSTNPQPKREPLTDEQIAAATGARDAERYRWLREASWNGGLGVAGRREKSRILVYKDGTGDTLFQIYFWGAPKQLDDSIDAAIAKSTEFFSNIK